MLGTDGALFGQSPASGSCLRRPKIKHVFLWLVGSTFLALFVMACSPPEDVVIEGCIAAGCSAAMSKHRVNSCYASATQERRQRLIASACGQHLRLKRPGRSWTYKVDQRHGLMYCPIPKAGWSSWKRLLFYINGAINSTDVEIGITPDATAGILEAGLPTALRLQSTKPKFLFTFVRDPWRRLVSAYINKALDWNYTRILHTPCKWETMEPYNKPITFSQFLTCIANASGSMLGLDIHWAPMWQLCDFCSLHYDYIGHLETVVEDADYIIKKNGLDVAFPRIFASRAHRIDDVIEPWYESVPLSVIQTLRALYEYDFKLHGYSDIPPGWEGKLS